MELIIIPLVIIWDATVILISGLIALVQLPFWLAKKIGEL